MFRALPALERPVVSLGSMALPAALTANAAARQARPAPATEATAPRDAGEPIMAIVSIKGQQVTFCDADGWILRAPVSTARTLWSSSKSLLALSLWESLHPEMAVGTGIRGSSSRAFSNENAKPHVHELGAIVGLAAQRLVRDDDRGSRHYGRRDAVEHILTLNMIRAAET
jgi:hypothetical protein